MRRRSYTLQPGEFERLQMGPARHYLRLQDLNLTMYPPSLRKIYLRGYDITKQAFVNIKINTWIFGHTAIREYTCCGERGSITFNGIEYGGYLLAALDGTEALC